MAEPVLANGGLEKLEKGLGKRKMNSQTMALISVITKNSTRKKGVESEVSSQKQEGEEWKAAAAVGAFQLLSKHAKGATSPTST
jgi:hypothetical protein